MHDFRLNLIDGLEKEEKINLGGPLEKSYDIKSNKKKIFRVAGIFIIVSFFLFSRGILTEESLIQEMPKISFWKGVARMLIFQEHLLRGEISDRTNILVLGMGGAEHEGPYLTDTIILASFKPSTDELALISFPRDLWVPIPGYGWGKINSANALGQANEKDGAKLASLVVGDITNLPIHYFIRLDFSGFKEIIDAVGGIEIEVENGFVDPMYPGPSFTYRTISFERGWQKMDGARALEYVRSRHGTNGEDSDFSRMRRQQKVFSAIKQKFLEMGTLQNPQKAWELFNLLGKYFKTNLSFDEALNFAGTFQNIREDKIIKKTFDLAEGSPIYSDVYNGAYILKTKSNDFSEISYIAKNIFNKEPVLNKSTLWEKPKIIVLNGTFTEGLARAKSEFLSDGFGVIELGNAEKRDYQETIIYDLTRGGKNKELENLKQKLGATDTTQDIPEEFAQKEADFIVILGER